MLYGELNVRKSLADIVCVRFILLESDDAITT